MYEQYFIQDQTFRNVIQNGEVNGFQIGIKITYYRGLFLSMVEALDVTVDGVTYTGDDLIFSVKGQSWPFNELEEVTDVRWDFGEVAMLTVQKPGGLSAGEHEVSIRQGLRISYLPFSPSWTSWSKTIRLAG